ncbi:MAG TPA: ABC transporter substrate-binding protein [Ktedonobacteraceae bacterium]|nr:ABC transporter substrate-binding protein [Ktedonobacteraceae bacterium]
MTNKAKIGMWFLPCLLIASMLLTACGGSAQTVHHKNYLTIVANTGGDFTRNFNPYSPSVNTGTQGLIYETLLYINRLDNTTQPWLASSYTLASDATSIKFTLRNGIKWSDNQPLTSADVIFTLNLLKKYPAMDLNGMMPYIKNFSAPDASTVQVNLNKSFYPILWFLGGQTFILPQHVWSKVKGDGSQYSDPNPVGTGPYILKSFTPQLFVLSKNPNFWQPGKPIVNELRYPAYNSNTSVELALQKGQIDWTNLYIPNIEKTYINLDKAHNHYWFPSSDIVMLYLNTAKYPFNLLPVRQAISYAINRDSVSKIGESGFEPPANPTGLLNYAKSYTAPEYANSAFTVNSTKAEQLLQSAGFTKGSDGIYVDKKGKKLSVGLNVVDGYTDYITDCQLMSKDLQAIGINVTVNTSAYDTFNSALLNGQYDMAILWTNPGPTPYYIYNGLLNSANTAPIGQQATSNYERWNDPQTDKLLDQYASTTDQAVQKQAIMGLEKIMVEQMPSVPLTAEPYWYEYSTANYVGWPDATHPYAAPGTAETPEVEYVLLHLQPAS